VCAGDFAAGKMIRARAAIWLTAVSLASHASNPKGQPRKYPVFGIFFVYTRHPTFLVQNEAQKCRIDSWKQWIFLTRHSAI
jgi:hypothetical protein